MSSEIRICPLKQILLLKLMNSDRTGRRQSDKTYLCDLSSSVLFKCRVDELRDSVKGRDPIVC
jgi:hypothetical protein